MKELCKNWPEAEDLVKDLRGALEDYDDSLVEMSVKKLFEEVDSFIVQLQDELDKAVAERVLEEIAPPSDEEPEVTTGHLAAIVEHARHLVEYLDGDRPEVDTDDLRFRLRSLGFSVNATTPVVLVMRQGARRGRVFGDDEG